MRSELDPKTQTFLDAAPDGIVVVDDAGHIVIVNSQTERMFGYARGELLGRSIEILVPYTSRTRHVTERDGRTTFRITIPEEKARS